MFTGYSDPACLLGIRIRHVYWVDHCTRGGSIDTEADHFQDCVERLD